VGWRRLLGSGLGLGLAPVAPGTCGTLLGVALAFVSPPFLVPALALAFAVAGVALGRAAETSAGHRDPRWFVLDEVAGYLAAAVALPVASRPAASLSAAFVAFRVFDVAKPWPCRRVERWPAGWGIVADDLVAGIYANAAARLVLALTA